MFVQFIEGSMTDGQAWRQQLDRWQERCADGAVGWLGTTAGVTDEGQAFASARFESADAARANSERPEQSAWWAETEQVFDGPVAFEDQDDVGVFRGGGSDEAGFVQVIRGRVNDVATARELFLEDMPDDARPDVLGGMLGMGTDGSYTMVVYFTSEAEARTGESQSTGEDLGRQMLALHDDPPRFLDLRDPWTWSP